MSFSEKGTKKKTLLYKIFDNELFVSAVTVFEVFAGSTSSDKQKDLTELLKVFTVLPFDSNCAGVAADLYKDLKSKNQLIDYRDLFIAATAISNDLPLATLNTKHFARIQNLTLIV